ncbi:uncharacterized protein PV06_04666 [Exophiala oligosperma]|uniref:F-box domain-containing protein n=1 Tax=Exophiala oligosperma TaxID=215243 RepID=A0A0D2AUV9_9EURO|nr:uncharacterized protein PV06_04666 [Exophiala oligosperma]KIW43576.1 hypothetical protein PV06_04666 [Exophiala oligosperma]
MAMSLVTPTSKPSPTVDLPYRPFPPYERPPRRFFPLLELPAETRLNVYRQLLPDVIEVSLCEASVARPNKASTCIGKSEASYYLSRFFALESLIRNSGLVLLQVCALVKNEILPLLNQLTVRFHCLKCLCEFFANNSYGLGVGISWIKHIEVLAAHENNNENLTALFPEPFQLFTPHLIRAMDRERAVSVMKQAQSLVRMYFGWPTRSPSEKWSRKLIPYITFPDNPAENGETFPDGWHILGQTEDGSFIVRFEYPIQLPPVTRYGSIPPECLMWPPPRPRCALRDFRNKWLITGRFDFEPDQ